MSKIVDFLRRDWEKTYDHFESLQRLPTGVEGGALVGLIMVPLLMGAMIAVEAPLVNETVTKPAQAIAQGNRDYLNKIVQTRGEGAITSPVEAQRTFDTLNTANGKKSGSVYAHLNGDEPIAKFDKLVEFAKALQTATVKTAELGKQR